MGELSTVKQRREHGRAARRVLSRNALATLPPRPTVWNLWRVLDAPRGHHLTSLQPLRDARMAKDALSFLRGSALVMTHDLVAGRSTPLTVTSCGDAHLANFGLFASPERRDVFDVTDFDEADVTPFEWDVKRLVTSLAVAGQTRGFSSADQQAIARAAAREYRVAMRRFAELGRLAVWYSTLDVNVMATDVKGSFDAAERKRLRAVLSSMKVPDDRRAEARFTSSDATPQIVRSTTHFSALEPKDETGMTSDDVAAIVRDYGASLDSGRQALLSQFTLVDVARHVVGVGSVGTECFAALLCGRDRDDVFFLQIKEAQPSALATIRRSPAIDSEAHRVVRAQRILQATPDPFLGWTRREINGEVRSFYVRQLYDRRATVDVSALNPELMASYGRRCGWTLARAHARAGESAVLAGYLGKSEAFDEAMATFALAYRDRNQEDFEVFLRGRPTEGGTVQS